MEKDYNQYYTSSLFNIKNKIDLSQKTIFINVFTNEDLEVFNKINNKIVIYNNELHFFNYLNNINKVIQNNIKIYSDNNKIREYLLKNRCNPKFIYKPYIKSNEIIDLKNVIQILNIKNIHICDDLKKFERIASIYKLKTEYNNHEPTIFFGCYSIDNVNKINNHVGIKYLMFGGNDCNLNTIYRINLFKSINFNTDLSFISISNDIYDRLVKYNKEYNLINKIIKSNLNLLNKNIWKKISILKNNIYVYDGILKKSDVYSSSICDKVIEFINIKYKMKINFIRTSNFKSFISQEELFKIYQKCFLGIRLTYHDGNANTVQEMQAINIPIIHNQSEYGLKWKNENDVIKIIEDEYKKNLISIIIPTYNRFELLKETINSILNQTYQIFEVIIVNDCSNDKNFMIYNDLEKLDDRIKVYKLNEWVLD